MEALTEKRQHWQAILKDWSLSGLSQTEYCRQHELNLKHFYSYKSKLMATPKPQGRFIPVETNKPSGSIRVHCSGVELSYDHDTDPTLLKQLIALLRQAS